MSCEQLLQEIRLNGTVPRHVAVIMDGNGRWARERGQPREFGHRAGMQAVRQAVEAAGDAGVEVLTLYAFSQENWGRPATEISALMGLLELYVRRERRDLKEKGIEVHCIGELDRLGPRTRAAWAWRVTAGCSSACLPSGAPSRCWWAPTAGWATSAARRRRSVTGARWSAWRCAPGVA